VSEQPAGEPAHIEPAQIDSQRIAVVGLAIFTVATVVLLPFYGWLGQHHHRIWLWTSIAGVGVGLFGYALSWRHKRRGRTQ
jgi:hypothetical protein